VTNLRPAYMPRMSLSKTQKALFAWTAVFLIAAEGLKLAHLEGRLATGVGLLEVVLAILTGIAFGVVTVAKKD